MKSPTKRGLQVVNSSPPSSSSPALLPGSNWGTTSNRSARLPDISKQIIGRIPSKQKELFVNYSKKTKDNVQSSLKLLIRRANDTPRTPGARPNPEPQKTQNPGPSDPPPNGLTAEEKTRQTRSAFPRTSRVATYPHPVRTRPTSKTIRHYSPNQSVNPAQIHQSCPPATAYMNHIIVHKKAGRPSPYFSTLPLITSKFMGHIIHQEREHMYTAPILGDGLETIASNFVSIDQASHKAKPPVVTKLGYLVHTHIRQPLPQFLDPLPYTCVQAHCPSVSNAERATHYYPPLNPSSRNEWVSH
ncbi:uncharacterized protein CLUP02_06763 [Colletotrichum lupini]|uniref:Uncharacterized protein n=1 Tax=Colletotrichum lupini TaxID=145971 RepID=A0A9Q8WFV5_9PEZI|nr:uncharacterized protein CLUP02_06763 [Colletotrichum lupini]UQC81277.1 hypothetical protein CLUP02_06763 [Colletotrichum lupini]